jgi:hypothetical protein
MRTLMKATTAAAFLAALALATGCEDTPLFAGKDFKMTLVAEPGEPNDAGKPTWNVIATIVNDTGIPQHGITVLFSSTSGGSLTLGTAGDTTDSNGRAVDVLTVEPDAPSSITVTATSAALTKTVTITTTGAGDCDINTPPTAEINPSGDILLPPKGTGTNTTVSTSDLSGTSSTDHQTPTAGFDYLWDCGGGTSTSSTDDHVVCTYSYQAATTPYTITLTVTDGGLIDVPGCEKSGQTSLTVTVPGTAP